MVFTLNLANDGTILQPSLTAPPLDTHKYRRGHAVMFSGPPLRTGASRLAAQAALAVGAGLVTIVGDRDALVEHAAHVTAIMLRETDAKLSIVDERVTALAIGPGAGVSSALKATVLNLLDRSISIVLDADALTIFQDKPGQLFTKLHGHSILTPHEGEFARLFPDIEFDDRTKAAVAAANRSGAVVLLKGPETVIATPQGQVAINRHSSPWLATAGSGDVLTGLICGLLAQGVAVFDAAAIAAWLHGDIGVRAGPGLTAAAMVGHIPLVLRGCLIEE
jgi:ADP-dependent NAD(P)H-hydrate dehydratase / NAD(P)H-hydrate epimerase